MITGKRRENKEYSKKIGMFEGKVVSINPDAEELVDLGIEVKEDSKQAEYLGVSKEGNDTVRISKWLEEVKSKDLYPVNFFIENKDRWNKDNTKLQYINILGNTAWSDKEENLKEKFKSREYRVAKSGEEELYKFLKAWLQLDYTDPNLNINLDLKKLFKGNVKELRDLIESDYAKVMKDGKDVAATVVALSHIRIVRKEGEDDKEYQTVYNREFLPGYTIKTFRAVKFTDEKIANLKERYDDDPNMLKPYEKFVVQIASKEYGIKDPYTFEELKEYNPNEFVIGSDKVVDATDAEY